MNEYLKMLRSTEEFRQVLEQVNKHKPVIPVYTSTPDNTEEWKANSNILKGFQLALTLLGETDV